MVPKFEPTALWRWSCDGRLEFQVRHVNVTLTADLEAEASDVWTLYLVQPLAERTGIWWMMLARAQSLKWPGNVLWLKCATKLLCDALLFFLVHTILYFMFLIAFCSTSQITTFLLDFHPRWQIFFSATSEQTPGKAALNSNDDSGVQPSTGQWDIWPFLAIPSGKRFTVCELERSTMLFMAKSTN